MAQGTTLVLPFTERLPNNVLSDPPQWMVSDDGSEPAAWPRFGEFRWRLPESAAHETEVRYAAVWRQADDAYCLFRLGLGLGLGLALGLGLGLGLGLAPGPRRLLPLQGAERRRAAARRRVLGWAGGASHARPAALLRRDVAACLTLP
jgi:hypothetical protein